VSLQKKTRDITEAYSNIDEVATALSDIRGDVETTFSAWFGEAEALAAGVNETITMPRTVSRQSHRPNQPADTAQDYFRRSIAVPFLDHLLSEFSYRFKHADMAHGGLLLVADQAARVENPHQLPEDITRLVQLWDSDLPSPNEMSAEFHRWCVKWRAVAEQQGTLLPSTVTNSLLNCSATFYPNISQLLTLVATLPVTTASCERSISSLKLLKTSLRSVMGEPRLNGLALMRIHRGIPVPPEAIVDAYSRRFKTRMAMQLPRQLLAQDLRQLFIGSYVFYVLYSHLLLQNCH
jgi:hypothetical protein